jgi:hypothetical protein
VANLEEGTLTVESTMMYTILEFWNGEWWRWWMQDGKPIAFVKEDTKPIPRGFE